MFYLRGSVHQARRTGASVDEHNIEVLIGKFVDLLDVVFERAICKCRICRTIRLGIDWVRSLADRFLIGWNQPIIESFAVAESLLENRKPFFVMFHRCAVGTLLQPEQR